MDACKFSNLELSPSPYLIFFLFIYIFFSNKLIDLLLFITCRANVGTYELSPSEARLSGRPNAT